MSTGRPRRLQVGDLFELLGSVLGLFLFLLVLFCGVPLRVALRSLHKRFMKGVPQELYITWLL